MHQRIFKNNDIRFRKRRDNHDDRNYRKRHFESTAKIKQKSN